MNEQHPVASQAEAAETKIQPKQRLVLQGKSASAQRQAQLHPASPSLLAQTLIGEGRLRSLEERKAAPLWQPLQE